MHKSIFYLLITSVAVAAQAVERPGGCFAVQISARSGAQQSKSLRLTEVPASTPWGTGGANQIVPARSGEHFDYDAAYWTFKGSDLVLTFTNNGLSGTELRVQPVEGGFKGVIQNFRDFGPGVDDVRPVRLTRFKCGRSG